jgi:hypothetical protein
MKCPKCNREILNRRKEKCEFCNHSLPKEFRFTDDQRNKIDNQNEQERKRHSEWQRSSNDSMINSDGIAGADFSGL